MARSLGKAPPSFGGGAIRNLHRWLEELRAGHSEAEVERALGSLVVGCDQNACIIVSRDGGGEPLFEMVHASVEGAASPHHVRADVARVGPGVYVKTPSLHARVCLLRAVAVLARRVEVHAPIATEGTHRGRLVIDNVRRALRALGLSTAEPGDRLDEAGFIHAYFDDEALIAEAGHAGLAFVARRGPWIVLARSESVVAERAAPFSAEVARVLRVIGEADRRRRRGPPQAAVLAMRARGRRARARGPIGRSRLRRAIGWVDAAFPTGSNCFRRTLVEVALDAGAAAETLVFGLDMGRTGHVAFKDAEDRAFDVTFEIPP